MKIKIVEKGYSKFNGNLSGVEFVNGVSVEGLNQQQVNQISAVLRVESVDGSSVGISESYVSNVNKPMPIVNSSVEEVEVEEKEEAPVKKLEYDLDSLSVIADEKGIAGLRDIGDLYGVKSNSVSDLINKIIKAQG